MAVTKQKKEEVIAELVDLFKNSKSVVFADYQGISVKDVQTLRRSLLEKDAKFKVAKKTLIKIAAKNAGFADIPEEALVGQVGVAFSMGDEIAAAKTLYDFSKTNESVKLLSAFMEGKTLTQAETIELAKIPGKDELLAKLVGSMKSPISGFHGVLYSLLRSFVGVVDAYRDSKPAEEAPKEEVKAEEAAPAEEAKAEEAPEEEKAEEPKAEEKSDDEEAPAEEAAAPADAEKKAEEEEPKETDEAAPAEEAKTEETTADDDTAKEEEEPKAKEKPAEEKSDDEKSADTAEEKSTEAEEAPADVEKPDDETPPKEEPAAPEEDNK